jgi:hypothetical protein
VSTSSATHLRVKSSTTAKTRNRRPASVTSLTKSMLHRSFGLVGGGITSLGAAASRLRRLVRTASPSAR